MSCKSWLMGALLVLLLTAVGPPNLCADIVNGDFSAGNTGFTSDYTYVSPADAQPAGPYPLGMWAEGTYTVDTDPHNQHELWASFGDHTQDSAKLMLIANGSTEAGLHVWIGGNSPSLVPGNYKFSAWVASAYPVNPAELIFSVGGTQIGTNFTASSTPGDWQQFTAVFYVAAGSPGFSAVDVNTLSAGNDFAIDDIHLQSVPDGGVTLMLLGGALVGLETLRRRFRA